MVLYQETVKPPVASPRLFGGDLFACFNWFFAQNVLPATMQKGDVGVSVFFSVFLFGVHRTMFFAIKSTAN